mmetsp:Transcript_53542/g.113716  ORF Transcript_53542/g.113716 Transcript_53542/m.113716 type:complete len:248 (+) Transcript_53542:1133-1876(+)
MRVSAASICSASSSGTCREPAQLSPSAVHLRLPAVSHVIQSVPKVCESTTVTTRLRSALSVAGWCVATACSQFRRTADGSATPLNSTTIASKSLPSIRSVTDVSSSSDSEQQAHPFCSSTVPPELPLPTALPLFRSPLFIGFEMSFASIFTLATSLTIVPTLIPSVFSNKRFNAVVFPAPRNPERIVIGIFAGLFFAPFVVAPAIDIAATGTPSLGGFLPTRITCAQVATAMAAPTPRWRVFIACEM